jgi:hypothetical protein
MKKVSVFVLALLTFLSLKTFSQEQSADKLIVYYFHGDFRCQTCTRIEQQTKEAISQNFKESIDKGKIEIRVVNYDKKENKHFKKDYGLFTKSVVLSLVQSGQETSFNNLQNVWQLFRNKEKFGEYIKSETQKYLDILVKEGTQQ